ncbi:MAG TPA: mechanosensitive ion channel family protein [Acidobacteriota bacterium]|nr:mechanosensitive ion channel family protein [Acidobacteriota bacterium]
MNDLLNWIRTILGSGQDWQWKLFLSVVVVLIILLLRKLVLIIAFRRFDDIKVRYYWRKVSLYITFMLILLAAVRIWFVGFEDWPTYLGLLSAGLAIALATPITNMAGWAFIIWRRPFSVGDRIEVGQIKGDVIDQRVFMFTVMEVGNWVDADQSTGRVVHIPNGKIFTEPLANYSKGFQYIWDEVAVLITFESDWRKAKEILTEIAFRNAEHLTKNAEQGVQKAAEKFMIFYKNLTPTVYTSVRDCGVLLTLRYLCQPRRRRSTQQSIWEDILEAFAQHDNIDFAYPTQRFYNNVSEGKEGTKPGKG